MCHARSAQQVIAHFIFLTVVRTPPAHKSAPIQMHFITKWLNTMLLMLPAAAG